MALLADNFARYGSAATSVPGQLGSLQATAPAVTGDWSRSGTGALRLLILSLGLALAASGAAPAPPQNEAEVKADYLFLFTKYVEWPAAALAKPDQPIVIGVIGDDAIGDALERRVEGRLTQSGRKVTIRRARQPADLGGCHVTFVGQGERGRLPKITESLGNQPALTVCDAEGLFTQGLMIKFVLVEGSVRFEVKLEPVERVGLSIQSGMLASAKRVWRKVSTSLEPP